MNYNDDNLDLVEETYLSEEQVISWLTCDTPRADCFKFEGELLLLNNMDPLYEPFPPPPPRNEMRALIERAFGTPKEEWNCCLNVLQPRGHFLCKGVRKLERPCDVTWTMFRHAGMVIGVHDGGTIVARDLLYWRAHEFRITNDGDFYCDGNAQDDTRLANRPTMRRASAIMDVAQLWVKRVKGRKMPPGFRRLKLRIRNILKADHFNFLGASTQMSSAIHPEQPMVSFLL